MKEKELLKLLLFWKRKQYNFENKLEEWKENFNHEKERSDYQLQAEQKVSCVLIN